MGKVISSNFNALLDKAEDPRKSIDLTLQEMHEQLKAARQEVVRSVAAEKQLKKKVQELDDEVRTWEQRAELAIRHDDDSLAREALLQKRRVTAERDRAEALRAEQRGNALEMKRELERMESKVEEVSARKGTLVAKAQQAKLASESGSNASVGGGAFAEFRRMEDQIEGVETALAAQSEIDIALNQPGPSGLSRAEVEAKFRQLEGSGEYSESGGTSPVDDELSALKKKIRIDS